ncbi:MAG: protein kinase [Gemmatimonadaceae bacterium]|nr:protein kinase [Gemmatimonadaceae bacterium]
MSFQDRLQQSIDADYLIERELGGGGMSRVFLATERALQRRVVIKVLPPELSAGVNVDRFRREIQLAAQLQHPHIVPLLATGDKDGILWFSMPFIEGESLRGALNSKKRLPARDVVRVLHDVVDALAYAHARGIVHRDIKPDNILTSGMHAMVTDFGVAKALSAAIPMAGGTSTGMAIGTPAYMAPEQLAADPAADHRVDIYAVGLLAYELVTGHSPFSGSSPQATMAAQLTETPKPPHQFANIPEGLSTLIMRCLEKDSAKRPQSAQALLAELDALPPLSSGASPAKAPSSRRTPLLIGALAVAATLTVIVAQQFRASRNASVATVASQTNSGDVAQRDSLSARRDGVVSAARPETVVVYRTDSDAGSGIQIPVVISRAESLAITEAFARRILEADRLAAQKAAPTNPAKSISLAVPPPSTSTSTNASVTTREATIMLSSDGKAFTLDRAQLIAELGKVFADSAAELYKRMDTSYLRAAQNMRFDMPRPTRTSLTPMVAPPSDGRMRLVVANFLNESNRPELASLGHDLGTAVRKGISSGTYDVVSESATSRALRAFGDPLSMGFGMRADIIIDGMIAPRGDSLLVVTRFHDIREGRGPRVFSQMTTVGESQRVVDGALKVVNEWLVNATAARARRPARPRTDSSARSGLDGRGAFEGSGPSSGSASWQEFPGPGGASPPTNGRRGGMRSGTMSGQQRPSPPAAAGGAAPATSGGTATKPPIPPTP